MTPEEKNIAKSNKATQKAIKDFINEPIGFMKVLKLDHLEQVLNKNIERLNQKDRFINYGISDVWSIIWQQNKTWVENYLDELEKAINSTTNKAELGMLYGLIPYNSISDPDNRIEKLNLIIYTKMNS